jgi:hypothetical protein
MIPRYAIYYAPSAAHPLSMAASAWLGRDAFTNSVCVRPALVGLDGIDLDQLTQDARHYGFHATLKAPFELHPAQDEASLLSAFRALTICHAPFQADIQVAALGPFLAFVLAERSSQMQALHQDCVVALDDFRAPLSDFDLNRRLHAGINPRHESQLREFGYPYIFEDFRFHMTLTERISDQALRAQVLAVLQDHFQDFAGPHDFKSLAIFKQEARDQPFTILDLQPLTGPGV